MNYEMNWKEAEKYLYEIAKAYKEIGWTGNFALSFTINPLIKRFEDGERTEELFDDIFYIT
jgi:hypothetical protein